MTSGVRLMVVLAVTLTGASCGRSLTETSGPGTVQTSSTSQATVTFASEPDPPQSGENSIVVTVKLHDGTPVADANVTVVFSMPAMPSMNMPAMRSEATLTSQSGGVYRGTGQLSMGGTWNVAVSLSRDGKDFGTAKFSVVAK